MNRRLLLPALALFAWMNLAAEPVVSGKYTGKWEGASGASGDFHITLSPAGEGKWNSEVAFSLGGQDVKCDVKAITVDDSKLHMVYTFDLQGTQLESTIDGEMSGKRLAGKYKTRVVADSSAVDEGTWETTVSN